MRTVIALVEDEADLREAVAEYLEDHGFEVRAHASAREFRAAAEWPALVVLDIAMVGEDGLSLAAWIRQNSACGIIFATSAGRNLDRIIGIELGADDYLVKPYDLRELVARIRAVLRRLTPETPAPAAVAVAEAAAAAEFRFGGFRLETGPRRLLGPDGQTVALTALEYELLEALARRPGRVLSRAQLTQLAHGRDAEPEDRSTDIRIARLRRKIEAEPAHPRFIRTMRGEGYVFSPEGA